ncbi:MAG: outer membrane beta-barrel protein [Bacteroidales bacterium]|nr:outer membrane beta-barrel protein [Bacteroidales bacterium]
MRNLALWMILAFTATLYAPGHANENETLKSMLKHDMLIQEDTVSPKKDTTEFRFKNKQVRITEDEKGTDIEVRDKDEKEGDFDDGEWDQDRDDDEGPDFDFDFNEGDDFNVHWAGFEIGLNNYLNNEFSLNLSEENQYMDLNTGKSWNVNINFIEYDLNLIGERFGVGTGLGLEFNDYRFDNQLPIEKSNGGIQPDLTYEDPDYNVEKAKLTTTYITVPLIMEYQVQVGKDNNKFFLGAGIIGGLKLGSHTKVKYDKDGDNKKNKNRSDFYLSPFRYGYTVRAGYGFLKLFANYYDTPLFEPGKGPALHPFTIGFMLSF